MQSPIVLTSEMFEPIVDAVTSNIGVLVPVGVGIMAVLIGVRLIPRIIYKFF